tara:strand:+ start:330 stop:1004 length:675 start_codon:yes stop_codon:yes gene_type:complete
MRAVYFESPQIVSDKITVQDDQLHHLKNVCRVKTGQEVLLLSGLGDKFFCVVELIGKREIVLKINKREHCPKVIKSAFVCLVKKDALELIVRQSVELGITDLYIVASERSQNYKINNTRLNQIIKSAMTQCNFPYFLTIHRASFLEFISENHHLVTCFSTEVKENDLLDIKGSERLPFIGPEGGFSPNEIKTLKDLNVPFISLPTPILRTETAFIFAQGLFSKA